MAVAVDSEFFAAIGGISDDYSQDIDSGDIIWMVPKFVEEDGGNIKLIRSHWEVLTLEDSEVKLQSARTVSRAGFEKALHEKLGPLVAH